MYAVNRDHRKNRDEQSKDRPTEQRRDPHVFPFDESWSSQFASLEKIAFFANIPYPNLIDKLKSHGRLRPPQRGHRPQRFEKYAEEVRNSIFN